MSDRPRIVHITSELDDRVRQIVDELREHDASLSFSSVTRDLWRYFDRLVRRTGDAAAAREQLMRRR